MSGRTLSSALLSRGQRVLVLEQSGKKLLIMEVQLASEESFLVKKRIYHGISITT
jgi:hypothetical protein